MILQERIDQVSEVVARAGLNDQTLSALREALDGVHLTYCLDDDIGAGIPPVREAEGFNVYLVDGRGHCMQFTTDIEAATGLVLAEVEADGDA